MARKSRKVRVEETGSEQSDIRIYRAAVYARLSVENCGKQDDMTLQRQIDDCKDYIDRQTDMILIDVYQDNGFTGTNFSRPQFMDMMDAVYRGEIDTIVVRDLSRFGRNYIDIQIYIGQIFPDMGVRMVALYDNFDTSRMDRNEMFIRLRNLLNEMYSRELSQKVSNTLHYQMEKGKFKWRLLPYGYKWNDDHTQVILDEEVAEYVTQMFQKRADGESIDGIARYLDEVQAPMPITRKQWEAGRRRSDRSTWSVSTITQILKNPTYLGQQVSGRYIQSYANDEKLRRTDASEWYFQEEKIDRLVEPEVFYTVQKIFADNSAYKKQHMAKTEKYRRKKVNLLKGRIYCAECGKPLTFKVHCDNPERDDTKYNVRYYCGLHARSPQKCGNNHNLNQDKLHKILLNNIRTYSLIAVDYDVLIRKWEQTELKERVITRLIKDEQKLGMRLSTAKRRIRGLYDDYLSEILDYETYMSLKQDYEQEINAMEKEMTALKGKRDKYSEAFSSNNKWINMMRKVKGIRKVSQELIDLCIEKVMIRPDSSAEIVLKYQDVFDMTKDIKEEIARITMESA